MKMIDQIHEGYVYSRRVGILSDRMAHLLPENARVLDVGCGDGLISSLIKVKRPDISIEGIDVLLRKKLFIPVQPFDGVHIPHQADSFDVVMFIDVLHHTEDPEVLIDEAMRVSKKYLLIKDHTKQGVFAGPILHFMDWVGNIRHGVTIPANYWAERRWRDTFLKKGLSVETWVKEIKLYPWWADWLFGQSLHFISSLTKR